MSIPFQVTEILFRERVSQAESYGRGTVTFAADVTILASVQPLVGKELERVPENRRVNQWKRIYSESEAVDTDRFVVDGTVYEIFKRDDYTGFGFGMDHYKYYCEKVGS